ncbi:U-box domain-containing protein 33 [Ananas comosus]|uniref:U-box domain-containing protein 33 n=1 Tax=Ananas comosus TaxID=4615 RepID=A0A199W8H8_ANACO|nr:U-box domain-containing protein 33 [Ananas comosus]
MEPSHEGPGDHQTAGNGDGAASSSIWEIEEVGDEAAVAGPPRHPTSISAKAAGVGGDDDDVYVAIGKSASSMDALSWALKNVAKPTSFVYLVHVFPVVHHIPTPLGMMPKSQLSREQVESYMNQERAKRREMLQKFLNLCHTSKAQVDIFLIESDQIVNAIIELIPVLRIQMLVVGTAKSNLKRWRRGNTKAEQIHKNAPHYCEVKIICEGKEVDATDGTPPPSPPSNTMINKNKESNKSPLSSPSHDNNKDAKNKDKEQKNRSKDSIFLRCCSGKSSE